MVLEFDFWLCWFGWLRFLKLEAFFEWFVQLWFISLVDSSFSLSFFSKAWRLIDICFKWFQNVISTSSFVYVTGWRFEDFYNSWPAASHCYSSFVCILLLCFSFYCNIAVALSYNSFCLNQNLQNQFLALFSLMGTFDI